MALWTKATQHEDNERTAEELRARIQKTLIFVDSVKEEQYANAASQRVSVSWAPPSQIILGENYLLQVVIPNTYFHMAMAYAILRHQGVDIGKMDFLGRIDWVDR